MTIEENFREIKFTKGFVETTAKEITLTFE